MSKKIWDEFYKKRGRYYLETHPYLSTLISKFKLLQVKKILDLGCGSGRHTIPLAKEGFSVTGLDFSNHALDLAEKWAKSCDVRVNWVVGNIHEKLGFKDNSFDACMAIDSLGYESSQALEDSIKEISRVLRARGLLFVTLPTQISNRLVTHMIFKEAEILEMVQKDFSVVNKFFDEEKYLCIVAMTKR